MKFKLILIITSIVLVAAVAIAGSLYFIVRNFSEHDNNGNELPPCNTNNNGASQTHEPPSNGQNVQKSAFEIVYDMGVGWNLGNTFDSIDNRGFGIRNELEDDITPEEYYETSWGNPLTTREMIETVTDAGFGAIRIPVTYTDHMDESFRIRHEWLVRVEQVVTYVLDTGAYCIINIHHDTGSGSWPWLKADPDNIDVLSDKLRIVWTQIATYFKDYDYKLIFEGFNEILDTGDNWNRADRTAYRAVNSLNQVFVDTVRSTGGNNAQRFLIVKTYAAGVDDDIVRAFILPEDSAKDRLIVSVHTYVPHAFTWTQEQVHWEQTYTDWEPSRDAAPVEAIMNRLNARLIEHGIPVIIGEFGAMNKNNTVDRVNYAQHFVDTARRYNIACFWWDDGGMFPDTLSVTSFALLDRVNNRWFFPEITEALVNAAGQ